MAKLFNRFGKMQRTANINDEGIGLGLEIVTKIVHEAGGEVQVKSPGIGFGSSFTFSMRLP